MTQKTHGTAEPCNWHTQILMLEDNVAAVLASTAVNEPELRFPRHLIVNCFILVLAPETICRKSGAFMAEICLTAGDEADHVKNEAKSFERPPKSVD